MWFRDARGMTWLTSLPASPSAQSPLPALRRVGRTEPLATLLSPATLVRSLWGENGQTFSLMWQFAKRDVVSRHRGSALGPLWVLLQPLITLAIYTFVFAIVWEARWSEAGKPGMSDFAHKAEFAILLFCGLIVFDIFSASINNAPLMVVNNPNYVKKVIFPLHVLPCSAVLASTMLSGVGIAVLLTANLAFRGEFSKTIWAFPFVLVPLVLMTTGLSLFISALGVFLRDLKVVVAVFVQILFFMTPILYPIEKLSKLPPWLHSILSLNPLLYIFESARATLVYGQMPDFRALAIITVLGVVLLQLGFAFFMKARRGFADVL